ncbi:hypothetical protein ACLMJK_002393 [Lecanora helva]
MGSNGYYSSTQALHQDLVAGSATTEPSKLMTTKATQQHRNGRVVKTRDRKITACTQCRDRKLKCDRGRPCSNCEDKAEDCVYVTNISELNKLPKRDVKKRKRAINVCWHCRTRKIPCNKERPCSHCVEDNLVCVYKRYELMNFEEGEACDYEPRARAAIDNEQCPVLQEPRQVVTQNTHPGTLHNNLYEPPWFSGPIQTPVFQMQQDWSFKGNYQYQLPLNQFHHQYLPPQSVSYTLPPPPSYGHHQGLGNGLPFGNHHTRVYNDEGYNSYAPRIDYQKDTVRAPLDSAYHYSDGHNAHRHSTNPFVPYTAEQTNSDTHVYDHSLPPLRDMVSLENGLKKNSPLQFTHQHMAHQHLYGKPTLPDTFLNPADSPHNLARPDMGEDARMQTAKGTAHMYN